MLKTKKIWFFLLFPLSLFVLFNLRKPPDSLTLIKVGKTPVWVEIASKPADKIKGLSGRLSLAHNQGMLFVYDQPGFYSFWMKGMLFPLDFIFIKDNEVVEIVENVPYPKEEKETPVILNSSQAFDMVLEVNAGFVKENKIKTGDQIERR